LDAAVLKKFVPVAKSDFYFCGQPEFCKSVVKMLKKLDVEPQRARFEFYGPYQDI